jgi:intein-encoded DNA endonuclease-like protein
MKKDNHFFYILGVLYGDGNLYIKKGIPDKMSLHVKDEDFALYFYNELRMIGANPKIKQCLEKYAIQFNKKPGEKRLMWRVNSYDKKISSEFNKIFNIKRNKIHLKLLNNNEKIKNFIKGVMDSEGWIGKHKRKDLKRGYNYSMGIGVTTNFIYDLKKLFDKLHIKTGKILSSKKKSIFGTCYVKYFHIKLRDYFNQNIGFSIKRKQERLDDFGKNFHKNVGCPKGTKAHNKKVYLDKLKILNENKVSINGMASEFNCSTMSIYKGLKKLKDGKNK